MTPSSRSAPEVIDGLAVKNLYRKIACLNAQIAEGGGSRHLRSRLRDCELALSVRIARMVERGEKMPEQGGAIP
jgi:hypothetical protein